MQIGREDPSPNHTERQKLVEYPRESRQTHQATALDLETCPAKVSNQGPARCPSKGSSQPQVSESRVDLPAKAAHNLASDRFRDTALSFGFADRLQAEFFKAKGTVRPPNRISRGEGSQDSGLASPSPSRSRDPRPRSTPNQKLEDSHFSQAKLPSDQRAATEPVGLVPGRSCSTGASTESRAAILTSAAHPIQQSLKDLRPGLKVLRISADLKESPELGSEAHLDEMLVPSGDTEINPLEGQPPEEEAGGQPEDPLGRQSMDRLKQHDLQPGRPARSASRLRATDTGVFQAKVIGSASALT